MHRDGASEALTSVSSVGAARAEPETLGDPFMFQDYYPDRSTDDVARDFGPGFARALFALPAGVWSGPLESGYGWHLVWLEDKTHPFIPELSAIEPEVRSAWVEEQRAGIRQRAFDAMRTRYEVVLPSDFELRVDSEAGGPVRIESPR